LIRTVQPAEEQQEPAIAMQRGLPMQLQSFPNPTNGAFTLRMYGLQPEEDTRIRIIDLNGRAIYSEIIANGYEFYEQTFDLSLQSTGLYLLIVEQGDRRESIRILRQ
jgi:hypothetical protein